MPLSKSSMSVDVPFSSLILVTPIDQLPLLPSLDKGVLALPPRQGVSLISHIVMPDPMVHSLMFYPYSTTSGLGIVPMTRAPNYCASRTTMHQFIMVLREQLGKTHVKVIEIFPLAVQSIPGPFPFTYQILTRSSRAPRREASARYQEWE